MPFLNRVDAGRQLALALTGYREKSPTVLALPRGGVPVAAAVATAFAAQLDLVLVRKIGVPWHRELAMGAVADGSSPTVVRNDDVIALAGVSEEAFDFACRYELAEIERRRRLYVGGRPRVDVAGRIAIVVDDGIATGATMRAALQTGRAQKPAKLVLAVPVAPTDVIEDLRTTADDIVCLEQHESLGAVGLFYDDFTQVSDQEVIETLKRFPPQTMADARQPAA